MAVHPEQDGDPTLGVVTMITSTELQLWIRGQVRLTMPLEELTLHYHPNIGDWVELEMTGANMFSLSKHNHPSLPTITWDGRRCFMAKINFLPLKGAHLHPASAAEKNLVLSWTEELGCIPLVFKNTFQNHCFYEGEAQINMESLSNLPALMKIEADYSTPWLIKKLEEAEYTFTRDHSFFDRFKQNGIVVKELSDCFLVNSKHTGLVAVAKLFAQGIRLGDWIQFHCIVNKGQCGEPKILVENFLPRRIEPLFSCVVSSDDTITIHHAIEVPINPTHMGVYEVEHLGNVQDVDGLINCKMENRVIQVKSVCVVDTEKEEATFHLCNVLDEASGLFTALSTQNDKVERKKESNEQHHGAGPSSQTSRFVADLTSPSNRSRRGGFVQHHQRSSRSSNYSFQNIVKPEGIVFSTGRQHVKLYSADPAIRNSIATITLEHICPLPALGDCVQLEMRSVGSHRRPEYVQTRAMKMEPLYKTRIIGGNILEVRTVVNIIKKDIIYAPKFDHIGNYSGCLQVGLEHEGHNCEIWITKIENNQLHWAVSSKPDPIWHSPPQPKAVSNAAAGAVRPSPYKFIGKQYINKRSTPPCSPTPTLNTEPVEQKPFSKAIQINLDNKNQAFFSTTNENSSNSYYAQAIKRQYSPTPPNSRQNSESSAGGPSPASRSTFGHLRRSSSPPPALTLPSPTATAIPNRPLSNPFKEDEDDDDQDTTTNNSQTKCVAEQQRKWPPPQHLKSLNNGCSSVRQWPTAAESLPPQKTPPRNLVAQELKPAAQNAPPAKEAFQFLGVCVSVVRDGAGVFVYTGSFPDQEAYLAVHTMTNNERVRHGDWLDFDAKYIGRKFIVTSYRRRAQPVYPTTTVRNTVQLTLMADVPINFHTHAQDFRTVHTEFVGSVLDDGNWVKPRNIHRKIEIIAIRRSKPDSKLPWQILRILREF